MLLSVSQSCHQITSTSWFSLQIFCQWAKVIYDNRFSNGCPFCSSSVYFRDVYTVFSIFFLPSPLNLSYSFSLQSQHSLFSVGLASHLAVQSLRGSEDAVGSYEASSGELTCNSVGYMFKKHDWEPWQLNSCVILHKALILFKPHFSHL